MSMILRRLQVFAVLTTLSFAVVMVGCSGSASEEEVRQLNDLKAEVASLEQQVAAREKEKADVEKKVTEKNGRLQQCMSDKDAVSKSMAK